MSALPRRRPRATLLISAALTCTAVLAGCGASDATGEAGSAAEVSVAPVGSSSAGASPAGALHGVEDLSAGLLPAEAFGAGTVTPITPITLEQLMARAQQAAGPLAGRLAGVTVTPESCSTALEAMRGAPPRPEDLEGFAAQAAEGAGTTVPTVQVLAAGPLVQDAVQQFQDAVSACPEATVTAPRLGTLTVSLQPLDAPAVGDRSAAVGVTATITPADGQPVTAPALVGMVQDGDRLVTLLSGGPGAAPDADTFLALLEQAYEHQAAALD
ncbi:hypothetical protein [Modestobacter sp. URMC 112]